LVDGIGSEVSLDNRHPHADVHMLIFL
jgi:hypothetical protein